MNKLEKMGAKIISQITIDSEFGWPPDCLGLIYQPERPTCSSNYNGTNLSNMSEQNEKKEQ